ncbi:MAG TPA: SPOR domain-containing protein [Pyrinomonadaceae bacterium]
MTTPELTHAPDLTGEEIKPFPPPLLDIAPPFILESEPTPFQENDPLSLDDEPVRPLALEEATRTTSIEYTPPSPTPAAATTPAVATPKPARKAKTSAPDPFAIGVRLLRMAPVWLLLTTFGCIALVLTLGWLKAGGDATAVALAPKQNDARAAKAAPKASAPAPKTAAANSPEVATPPAAQPAQAAAAPAPVEQPAPAPKAPEKAQAEQPAANTTSADTGAKFTVQVGSYNSQSEANEHVSRLRAAGFESRSAAVELPGRGTWFRVQVGRFADRAEASKAVGQLRAKGAASSALVAPLQN